MVGAPGHGKGVVDGLNAVDKTFLRDYMSKISVPGVVSKKKQWMPMIALQQAALVWHPYVLICSVCHQENKMQSAPLSVPRNNRSPNTNTSIIMWRTNVMFIITDSKWTMISQSFQSSLMQDPTSLQEGHVALQPIIMFVVIG